MKALNGYLPILTGSRAYGVPRPDSDIDLVVFIGKVEMSVLRQTITREEEVVARQNHARVGHCESDLALEQCSDTLQFGRMNLILVTCPWDYLSWFVGTTFLKERKEGGFPASRDYAIEVFRITRRLIREGFCNAKIPVKQVFFKAITKGLEKLDYGTDPDLSWT